MAASDRNQFKVDQANHTSMITLRTIKKALPGAGSAGVETAPARRKAATQPTQAASVAPSRKKLSANSERNRQFFIPFGVELWLRRKWATRASSVAALASEATTTQANVNASASRAVVSTARKVLPRKICSRAREMSAG